MGGVIGASFRARTPHAFRAGASCVASRSDRLGPPAGSTGSFPASTFSAFSLDALAPEAAFASAVAADDDGGDDLPSDAPPSAGAAGFPPCAGLDLTIADQGAFTGREGGTGALCTWFEDGKGSKVGLRGRKGMRAGCSGARGFLGGCPGRVTREARGMGKKFSRDVSPCAVR